VSRQSSASQTTQKQPLNVYTVMLIISFLALLISCILMYMELNLYGEFPWWK
jgi:hypothetical protein